MADDNRAEVIIGAKVDEATSAINELKNKFSEFSSSTQNHFGALGSATEKLTGYLGGLTEAFLSFEGIKHAVESTKELELSVGLLAQKLAITSEEAGVLDIALKMVGSSGEAYAGMFLKFERRMVASSERMKELGVDVDAIKNGQKSANTVFEEAVQHMLDYKVGHDQATYALEVFGRNVEEVYKLQNINNEVKERATQLEAMGVQVTQQNISASKDYRAAMVGVGVVFEGFTKTLGDAFMPLLTDLGNWFVDMGPSSISVFGAAVKAVMTVLDTLYFAIKQVLEVLGGFFRMVVVGFATIGHIMVAAASGDWNGVVAAWKAGGDSLAAEDDRIRTRTEANWVAFKSRMDMRWSPDMTPSSPKGGTGTVPPKNVAADASDIDTEITLSKQRLQIANEFFKQEADAKRITEAEKVEFERAAMVQQLDIEQALLEKKLALYDENKAEENAAYVATWNKLVVLAGQRNVDLAKKDQELEAAKRKDRNLTLKNAADDIKQEISLVDAGMKIEEDELQQMVELQQISAVQKLNIQKELAQNIYEFKRGKLEQELAMYDEADKTQEKQRRDAIKALQKLDTDYNVSVRKNSLDTTKSIYQEWVTTLTPISNAFANMVKGVAMGTQTLRQGLANLFEAILGEFLSLIASMMVRWAALEAYKLATTEAGSAARALLDSQTTLAAIVQSKLQSLGLIQNAAAVGAANAAASTAAIPVVGPALAPAAAAAMAAEIEALGVGLMSFDKGTPYVPHDMVAKIHQGERIVTAAENARGGGGMTVNISAVDAAGVRKLFMDNGPALSDAIRRQARNFTPTVAK